MSIIQQYNKAKQGIYDHVGFTEDYVVYPISDETQMFWSFDGQNIRFHKDKDVVKSDDGDYYSAEVYTQRFYKKWVYEGKDYTMIFGYPGVDGMKYFYIFDNKKRLPA